LWRSNARQNLKFCAGVIDSQSQAWYHDGMYSEPPSMSAFDEEVYDYLQYVKECSLLLAMAIEEEEMKDEDKEGKGANKD